MKLYKITTTIGNNSNVCSYNVLAKDMKYAVEKVEKKIMKNYTDELVDGVEFVTNIDIK